MAENTNNPQPQRRRLSRRQSHCSTTYASSTPPGSTMPISPLISMASAADAHAVSIHGLRCAAELRYANRKNNSVAVMNRVRPLSSVFICEVMMKQGLAERISAA